MENTMTAIKTTFLTLFALSLFTSCIYAQTPQSSDALVFCITGDSRGKPKGETINKDIIQKLTDAFKEEKPAFVLVSGDLVSGYSSKLEQQLTEWRNTFMAPLLDAGIKVYPCRGNHDASPKKIAYNVWQKVFSGKFALPDNGPDGEKGATYFLKDKNVLVLVLDLYGKKGPTHKVNTAWMEKVIKEEKGNNPMHVFAMAHEPAFRARHKDCLASKPAERDKFLELLLSNGGVCYFCGHDHFYSHAKVALDKGEFHQFICGTAGAPLYDWKGKYADTRVKEIKADKAFGYMVVKIKGNTAVLTAKAWDKKGKLTTVDEFSYTLK